MTKEVFIQQFEKEFTVYEQVQLIKKYLKEQTFDFLNTDFLEKKYLEIIVWKDNLAQILEDNFSNEKVFILNDKYLVTRTKETTSTTKPKDITTFVLFDLQRISYYVATKTRLISDNTITYKNIDYGFVEDIVWTEDKSLYSDIMYYTRGNDNIIFELGVKNPENDLPYSKFYLDKTSVELTATNNINLNANNVKVNNDPIFRGFNRGSANEKKLSDYQTTTINLYDDTYFIVDVTVNDQDVLTFELKNNSKLYLTLDFPVDRLILNYARTNGNGNVSIIDRTRYGLLNNLNGADDGWIVFDSVPATDTYRGLLFTYERSTNTLFIDECWAGVL